MKNAITMNTPNTTLSNQRGSQNSNTSPLHLLAQSTLNIASLPSAPTFDWTTKAAHAISRLHPATTFGVIIAHHSHDHNRLNTESAGVCSPSSPESDFAEPINADLARCSLDRIGLAPLNIDPAFQRTGLITTAQRLLPHWYASPQSQPWSSNLIQNTTIAAYAPIEHAGQTPQTQTTLALLILAKPHQTTHQQPRPLNPELLAAAASAMAHKAKGTFQRQGPNSILWLTQREQTILDHLVEGKSVRAIADCIGRSPHTVHDHVKNLHRKLNANSRGQLIANTLGCPAMTPFNSMPELHIDPELMDQYTNTDPANQQYIPSELKLAQAPLESTPQARPQTASPMNTASAPGRILATPLNRSSL